MLELQDAVFSLCPNRHCNFDGSILEDADLEYKLYGLTDPLGGKPLVYTLLGNIPDLTFDDIFEELGPRKEDTIKYCNNAGQACNMTSMRKVSSGQFPICFEYAVQENKESHLMSDEGISSGVTFILNTASIATDIFLQTYEEPFPFAGFQNAFNPTSADGFRLLINSPGEAANIDQKGINISPGLSTMIAISGKETIRLSEPHGTCTQTDYELNLLKEKTKTFLGQMLETFDKDTYSTYSAQDCRSACLQSLVLDQCKCLDVESKLPFRHLNNILCGTFNQTGMEILLNPEVYDKEECFTDVTELAYSTKCTFIHKMIDDLACVAAVKKRFREETASGEIQCLCPPACHSYEYDLSISQSPWPARGAETEAAYHDLVWIDKDGLQYLQDQQDPIV